MAPEERQVLAAAHLTLGAALVTLAERAGLGEQAALVAHRLGRRGLEHDPVQLVALHSEALALIAETLAAADRPALADTVHDGRGRGARAVPSPAA